MLSLVYVYILPQNAHKIKSANCAICTKGNGLHQIEKAQQKTHHGTECTETHKTGNKSKIKRTPHIEAYREPIFFLKWCIFVHVDEKRPQLQQSAPARASPARTPNGQRGQRQEAEKRQSTAGNSIIIHDQPGRRYKTISRRDIYNIISIYTGKEKKAPPGDYNI